MFNLVPLLKTFIDAMHNNAGTFIGFTNYEILFNDEEFIIAIKNTVYMGALGVCLNIPFAFIFANMLNRIPRGKNLFKVIFLTPMIISIVAVALIFKFIFSADSAGVINYFLSLFGISPKGWFSDPSMSRETVIIMAIWKGIGYNIILLFAGLQTIPSEYYEAASIDGANEFQKTTKITLPCLRNTLIFVYLTSCISVLKRFADVYAISGEYGNPANTLLTVILYIYKKMFSTLFFKDVGIGSAASIVLFFIILFITCINYILTEEREMSLFRGGKRRENI